VARELKYSTHATDLDALQRELSTSPEDSYDSEDEAAEDQDDGWAHASR
jgi:hypothetical protein